MSHLSLISVIFIKFFLEQIVVFTYSILYFLSLLIKIIEKNGDLNQGYRFHYSFYDVFVLERNKEPNNLMDL